MTFSWPSAKLTVLLCLLLNTLPADAAETAPSDELIEAKRLLNDYYGDTANLKRAAELLERVLAKNPDSDEALVQAARATLKGGHVVFAKFRPGTLNLFDQLIQRALAINPNNTNALSLRAQVALLNNRTTAALKDIQQGLKLKPDDPWLHLNMARYHELTDQNLKAIDEYELVVRKGPGSNDDVDQKRAYPEAIYGMANMFGVPENGPMLRNLADKADKTRHQKNAWILGEFADLFIGIGMFDDGIDYARKALRVMDYGAGRCILAGGLYGKAALQTSQGKDGMAAFTEARSLRCDEAQAIARLKERGSPNVIALIPQLKALQKAAGLAR